MSACVTRLTPAFVAAIEASLSSVNQVCPFHVRRDSAKRSPRNAAYSPPASRSHRMATNLAESPGGSTSATWIRGMSRAGVGALSGAYAPVYHPGGMAAVAVFPRASCIQRRSHSGSPAS